MVTVAAQSAFSRQADIGRFMTDSIPCGIKTQLLYAIARSWEHPAGQHPSVPGQPEGGSSTPAAHGSALVASAFVLLIRRQHRKPGQLLGRHILFTAYKLPVSCFLSGKTEFEASFAGTATHTFMQFCDFDSLAIHGAEAELARLRTEGFLSAAMADAVRLEEIELFRQSDLFARMRRSSYIRREFRFNASLPAWEFTEDESLADELRREGADIIVQGVVDCLFIDADGRAVLVDYKTDRLTDKEIADPTLAAAKLISRHKTQLKYYRAVCAGMFEREIDECVIYSLPLGREIKVE